LSDRALAGDSRDPIDSKLADSSEMVVAEKARVTSPALRVRRRALSPTLLCWRIADALFGERSLVAATGSAIAALPYHMSRDFGIYDALVRISDSQRERGIPRRGALLFRA
jgi:hypothetical protein